MKQGLIPGCSMGRVPTVEAPRAPIRCQSTMSVGQSRRLCGPDLAGHKSLTLILEQYVVFPLWGADGAVA